jgi:hypothetical protein
VEIITVLLSCLLLKEGKKEITVRFRSGDAYDDAVHLVRHGLKKKKIKRGFQGVN